MRWPPSQARSLFRLHAHILLTSGSVSHRMAVAGARRSSSLMAEEVRPLAADSRYLPAGRKGRQISTDKWPTRQAAAQARQQQALPSLVAQLKQHGAPRHTKVMSREDVCNPGRWTRGREGGPVERRQQARTCERHAELTRAMAKLRPLDPPSSQAPQRTARAIQIPC